MKSCIGKSETLQHLISVDKEYRLVGVDHLCIEGGLRVVQKCGLWLCIWWICVHLNLMNLHAWEKYRHKVLRGKFSKMAAGLVVESLVQHGRIKQFWSLSIKVLSVLSPQAALLLLLKVRFRCGVTLERISETKPRVWNGKIAVCLT